MKCRFRVWGFGFPIKPLPGSFRKILGALLQGPEAHSLFPAAFPRHPDT